MTARIVTIADAVKDALNDATLSRVFTAGRSYCQPSAGDITTDQTVTVFCESFRLGRANRNQDEFGYPVGIALQRQLENDLPATVDPEIEFVEEFVDFLRGDDGDAANVLVEGMWQDEIVVVAAPYYPHLEDNQVFTGLVRVTFKEVR